MTDNNEESVVEPTTKGISDVFSDGVLSAISELDAELITQVPDEKLPGLKRAIQKEYELTDEEVEFVLNLKRKQKEDNLESKKRRDTVRVNKPNADDSKEEDVPEDDTQDKYKYQANIMLIDPISQEALLNPVILPCGHSFSEKTIGKVVQKFNACPLCSSATTLKDIKPNYTLRQRLNEREAEANGAQSDEIKFSVTSEFSAIPFNTSREILLMANVTAPTLRSSDRLPMNVVFIVDCGKNDQLGDKLKYSKLALKFVLTHLNENDSFALLTSMKDLETMVELTSLTKDQRDLITQAVDGMQTTESTIELKSLLEKANSFLSQKKSDEKYYNQIAIITDSSGIHVKDTIDIKSITCPVTVFQVSNCDFASELRDLAVQTKGMYYYAENVSPAIGQAIGDYTGCLISILDNANLKVTLDNRITLKKVHTNLPFKSTEHEILIDMGEVHYEEDKNILLSVEVPEETDEKAEYPIASFDITFENTGVKFTRKLTVSRPASVTPLQQMSAYSVDRQRCRLLSVDAFFGASKSDAPGDLLKETSKKIRDAASSNDLFVQCLMSNLMECSDGSANRGKLTSLALAHNFQRSTHALPLYMTSRKSKTMEVYDEFAERRTMTRKASTKVMKKTRSITLKDSVTLPKGVEQNDWLAEHVEVFLDQAQRMYGFVFDKCECPEMTAGPNFTFLWADGVTVKTPVSLPAKDYITALFSWIQSQTQDKKLFPPKTSKLVNYSKKFIPTLKNIYKRLFRVYAHIYHSHVTQINSKEEFISSLKWFYYFVTTYQLVDLKEMEPLDELLKSFEVQAN